MPEYIDHPVRDMKTWEEKCLWRMNPSSKGRREKIEKAIEGAKIAADKGQIISAILVGGYMYISSLIGPMDLPYLFYDDHDLIHRCMEAWLNLDVSIRRCRKE
jgi:hypothetical protein